MVGLSVNQKVKCPVCTDDGAIKYAIVAGRQQYKCARKGCRSLFFADRAAEYGHEITTVLNEPNDANLQRPAAPADPVAQPAGQKATTEQPKQLPVASPPSTPAPPAKAALAATKAVVERLVGDPDVVGTTRVGTIRRVSLDTVDVPISAQTAVPEVTKLTPAGLCSKCGEPVMKGQDHCDKCGEPAKTIIPRFEDLPPVPPKPVGGGKGSGTLNIRIGQYYDQHREQIELEMKRYGILRVLERWHIGGGTWVGLKRRWYGPTQPKLPLPSAVSKPKSPVRTEATIPEGKPGDEWRETRPLGPFKDSARVKAEPPPQTDGKYPVNLSLKALAMNIDVAVSLFDSDVLKRINQGEHPLDAFSDAFTDWTSDVIPERLATWAAALGNPDVSQTLKLIAGFLSRLNERCPTDEPPSEPRGKRNEPETPADGKSLVPVVPGDQLPAIPEPVGKAIREIQEELKAINENIYNIYNEGLGVGLTEAQEAKIIFCYVTTYKMDTQACTNLLKLVKALEGV